jgi:hypothetical protein
MGDMVEMRTLNRFKNVLKFSTDSDEISRLTQSKQETNYQSLEIGTPTSLPPVSSTFSPIRHLHSQTVHKDWAAAESNPILTEIYRRLRDPEDTADHFTKSLNCRPSQKF